MKQAHLFRVGLPFLLLAIAGCGEPAESEPVGTLGLKLAADMNGLRYRLTNATFNVTGPQTLVIQPSPNSLTTQSTLTQGSYSIDLLDGWVLEKENAPGGTSSPIAAQVVSPDPFGFTIAQGQTTPVGYAFLAGGTVVGMGNGTLDLSIGVTDPNNLPRVFALAAGGQHTCALIGSGKVRCWGLNSSGQLGYGITANVGDDEVAGSAGDVAVGADVAQLSAGNSHTCALLKNGAVRCWGLNSSGQLGYGNTNNIGDNELPASAGDVPLGASAKAIAAGGNHTCALLTSGSVKCWGANGSGQLGYGNTVTLGDDESVSVLGTVNLGGAAARITVGNAHTCALMEGTNSVRCWGFGGLGRLGYANTNNIGDDEAPASVGDVNVGGPVSQVEASFFHTCARLTSGSVRCWGYGSAGRLGYGTTNNIGDDETPSSAGDVNVGASVLGIAPGGDHTCAVVAGGLVRCWGSGAFGALGYGNTADALVPGGNVNVGSLVASIVAGNGHTCALLTGSGEVRCWGTGASGRLGHGNMNNIGDDEAPGSAGNVPILTSSFQLDVSVTGTGTVSSSPAGISQCGGVAPDCSESYASGTSVTLTATPTAPAVFSGWSGSCAGSAPTATVVMDQARSCAATFSTPTGGAMPTFAAAGAGIAGTGNLNVPYPSNVAANQLLVLQIGTRTGNAVTTPTGWTLLHTDVGAVSPARQRLFTKFAAGGETGSLAVTIATAAVNVGRIYSFTGVRATSFTEGSVLVTDDDGSLPGPVLTTFGPNRLGVCFVAVDNDPALGSFTGETGGDWNEVVGEFLDPGGIFGLQLQTAPMSTAGTITGGVSTFGSGSDGSLCRAFALIGP